MPDGLSTVEERALAWLAKWHPSLEGTAIINPDFTFRAVNPQFCKILGVTPAELINHSFSDVSPEPVKTLDMDNAKLVMHGVITTYTMNKQYEMKDGRRVSVILLVKGVYHPLTNDFLFFVSSILGLDEEKLEAQSLSQMPIGLLSSIDTKKTWWAIVLTLASVLAVAFEKLVRVFL